MNIFSFFKQKEHTQLLSVPPKFLIGEIVVGGEAGIMTTCIGEVMKITIDNYFSGTFYNNRHWGISGEKCYWYKIKVFASYADGVSKPKTIRAKESNTTSLYEYIKMEETRKESVFYKEQMNDPEQQPYGVKLDLKLSWAKTISQQLYNNFP